MAEVRAKVRVPLCTNMCVVRFEDVVPAIKLGLATAAHLHVTTATPLIDYAIDTVYDLFDDDIIAEPLTITGGTMAVPDGPGLGVEPDLDKLKRYAGLHADQGDLLL